MTTLDWLILAQFGAAWYLAGVIWLIQLVHYPMLAELNPADAGESCRRHASRITPVVGVPMLIEAACAVALVLLEQPRPGFALLAWLGLIVVVLLWAVTFLVQVPQHARLARQSGAIDGAAIANLVRWNWCRTALWTLRAILTAAILVTGFRAHVD